MKLTEQQINCAVEWWKKAITGIPKFDMGDSSDVGGWSMMLAVIAHKDSSPDLIERFGENLRQHLEAVDADWFTLSVDYDPDRVLAQCYLDAGGESAEKTVFPWKTVMWFENGGVQVAHGYGAKKQELLPSTTAT